MSKIISIFNCRDGLLVNCLRLVALAFTAIVVTAAGSAAGEPAKTSRVRIRCRTPLVYRRDNVVVDLDPPHNNFDFAIDVHYGLRLFVAHPKPNKLFLLTFEPGKNDRIPPVIPPQKFALMRQITLNTATARGSVSNLWRGEEVPRALKPPELIFTDSGSYEMLLGLALGAEDTDFTTCYVDYVNEERQPGARLPPELLYGLMENTFQQGGCSARIYETAITCPRTTVYRGEALAVDLTSEDPAGRIGIVDPDWNLYLFQAEKRAGRGAHPGLRVVAGSETARAYSYDSAPSYARPSVHVETRGGRVFTKTGWYLALPVSGPRCDDTTDFGACWIHYVDAPPAR